MTPLSLKQINSFLEKIGEVFDLEVSNENVSALVDKISTNKKLVDAITKKLTSLDLPVNTQSIDKLSLFKNDCVDYTAPFPSDFYILDEVKTLRPEYLIGTWFNTQQRPFKLNMEIDWVNRRSYSKCYLPATPMSIALYTSTGELIWDFISEVHVHRTAMKEFVRPRDGWIEAPDFLSWKDEAADSPLNYIERKIKAPESRTVMLLKSGTGGWATFEHVRNSDVTAAAARLLFRFSDPLYCARSDGKVVIKLKDASRCTITDMSKFPTGRTLVNDQNQFPSCIP